MNGEKFFSRDKEKFFARGQVYSFKFWLTTISLYEI